MAERLDPSPVAAGEDAAPALDGGTPARPAGRVPWRPRWPAGRRRRPPWWEVPPQGYLEVESRYSPTSPRALRSIARATVRAGLSWDPGSPLPVQRFVSSQERARLVFQARRELPRVTAVASQVMLVDRRLAQAEETLRQAVDHRLAVAAAAETAAQVDARPERPARTALLGPWSEVAILAATAGGQAVLAATAARGARLCGRRPAHRPRHRPARGHRPGVRRSAPAAPAGRRRRRRGARLWGGPDHRRRPARAPGRPAGPGPGAARPGDGGILCGNSARGRRRRRLPLA